MVRFGGCALGLWSIGVWLVKAIDIAFLSWFPVPRIVVFRPQRPSVSFVVSVVAIRAVERRSAASNGPA